MKKAGRFLVIVMALAMLITLSVATKTQAVTQKSENEVTYTLKDGTLTIKGKGKMPKNMTFKYNKEIKKVVIKKGITSIPKAAFEGCSKLKKVKISNTVKKIGKYCFEGTAIEKITIPKSVKKIGQCAFEDCENLKRVTMPGGVNIICDGNDMGIEALNTDITLESVTYNTNFKVKSAAYFKTKNLHVMKNDKKFKSVDGVVYTKDGKSIVRVPNARKRVEIIDGCKEFCLQSVLYCASYIEGDGINYCKNLSSITISKSVTKINETKYKQYGGFIDAGDEAKPSLVVLTERLTGDDYNKLLYYFEETSCSELQKQVPKKIKEVNGMYISYDGVFLGYEGDAETITIPNTVTKIGAYALYESYVDNRVKKVNLPDTITTIGKYAFYSSLIEFNKLPAKLEKVGDGAFAYCKGFESERLILPETLKTIGKSAFKYIDWTELTIPESVTKIGDEAFVADEETKRKVTIKCKSKNISNTAFTWNRDDCKKLELNYENKIKNSKTSVYLQHNWNVKNGKLKVKVVWAKVSDVSGYQIEVSTNRKFKKNTKVIWAGKKATTKKLTVKNVDKDANVYARIRPYKKVNGKKVYGKWVMAP